MADLRLLGPLEVLDDHGGPIKLSGSRQRGLLARLALNSPAMVSTDVIIEALWGSGVAKPDAALHMAMSRLRGAIGDEAVTTEPGGYRLDIPVGNSDLNRFRSLVVRGRQLVTLGHPEEGCERFRQALAQWRGPVLADLREFEFAEQAARQLDEERVVVVEQLMDAMLAAGEHDLVVGELFGLVEAFPYRERLWELLMLALYRSGRQTEALEAFRDLRRRLGEDLGLEPSPELVDLEERILLHDPVLADVRPSPFVTDPEIEYLEFAPGDVIVEQDTISSAIYWIEEGRVEVVKADEAGTHRLAELDQGRYFGELAATLGVRRTATVRAVTPTTVSVHDLQTLRSRLGSERKKAAPTKDAPGELRELINRGEYLQAFDVALSRIETGDVSPEVRWLAVLALARSGATTQARRRYAQFGLDTIKPESIPQRLADDIAVLAARLDKDEALARPGTEEGQKWAVRAATAYGSAFEASGSPYHAINAATLWLLAGESVKASDLADAALDSEALQGHGYWDAVSEAEAALIIGDLDRAASALSVAADAAGGGPAQRATTLKQLKLVCELRDIDPVVLTPIKNRAVVHFCGHRILPEGEQGRFPADEEDRVRAELDEIFDELDVGVGYGSLAAGADILAAEALLERGAELHVVLPFDKAEFVRTSVVTAGVEWVQRFERCLGRAATVEIASRGEYLNDPVMFDYCARIAMGDALLRARYLETEVHQVAVWDGTPSYGVAGTAVDVRTWGAAGAPTRVVAVSAAGDSSAPPGTSVPDRRHIRAIVFADFAGFSRLTDAQLVAFQDRVMKRLSAVLEPYRPQMLSGRTWGDGIYLVFSDVAGAAECALDLVQAVAEIDVAAAGLPQLRGLRVAAHASPVFEGWDPISGSGLFYGVGVTQAARIEPRTPEGEIYTTHAFAALAMLSASGSFECQYVGVLPTAKQFGEMPLYALRRLSDGLR